MKRTVILICIFSCLAGLLGVLAIHYREHLFSDEQVSESISPSGRFAAGTFLRDAGMGEWVTYVAIRSAEGSFCPRIEDAIVVLADPASPTLTWLGEDRLRVGLRHGLGSRVMRQQKNRWNGVIVEYQYSPEGSHL
jgi:hypothetical protein